jgi:DNA-binding protein Fis
VKNCVKEAAQKDDPQTTLRSVSAVHAVIQNSFAELGIKDPEDLWNLVLTSLADEYWCEIQNQCVDDHENGE